MEKGTDGLMIRQITMRNVREPESLKEAKNFRKMIFEKN